MDVPPLPIFSTAEEVTLTPIKRAEASARALRFFFTGRPCAHGHVARRYVSTGTCVVCQREHSLQHSKLYRTLRVQRAISVPFIILQGSEEQLATMRALAKAYGVAIKEMPIGPREQARIARRAPSNWKPPQELVAPVLVQTRPVSLPSGMGADWQTTVDDRANETVELNPGMQWREPRIDAPTPPPLPLPPHLLPGGKP